MSICTCPVEGVGHWPDCPAGLLTDVPWDFIARQQHTLELLALRRGHTTTAPAPARQLTPAQATRRRLIAAGKWVRP